MPTVANSAVVRENRPPQFDQLRVASMPPWNEARCDDSWAWFSSYPCWRPSLPQHRKCAMPATNRTVLKMNRDSSLAAGLTHRELEKNAAHARHDRVWGRTWPKDSRNRNPRGWMLRKSSPVFDRAGSSPRVDRDDRHLCPRIGVA